MFEIRDLRHLIYIDEFRNFGRAAGAAGLSQSAITKSLQRMERELGVKLFERSRAGVTPTAVGVEVVARARRLINDAVELKRTVDAMNDPHAGSVVVGIGPAMSESSVSDAIADFIHRRPQSQVRVRVDHWHQLTRWLLAGEIDFYIADVAHTEREARLQYIRLPPQQFYWFCRGGHPLTSTRRKKPLSRGDLVRYPIATPKMPPWAIDWFASAFQENGADGLPRPFPAVECESYAMLKRIVLSTDCVSAALRQTLAAELEDGTLVALPVQASPIETHAGIVRMADRAPSLVAADLIASIERQANHPR
jgi:DNA-binding transcriptional LysR family regulator